MRRSIETAFDRSAIRAQGMPAWKSVYFFNAFAALFNLIEDSRRCKRALQGMGKIATKFPWVWLTDDPIDHIRQVRAWAGLSRNP